MRNPIKWYRELWPVERYCVKNMVIALGVVLFSATVFGVITLSGLDRDDPVLAVQAGVFAIGGATVAIVYWVRALRGKK